MKEKIFNDIEVVAFDGDTEEVAVKSGVVAKPTTMPLDIEQTFRAKICQVISIHSSERSPKKRKKRCSKTKPFIRSIIYDR
jgi:hypothetical protein